MPPWPATSPKWRSSAARRPRRRRGSRRALAEAPGDPRLRFLAGLLAAEAGRPAEARALWQALLADTPADAPWRGMLERAAQRLP